MPARRIVANLAPADLRKAGPQYDLPIALAILAASGQLARRGAPGGRRGWASSALDGSLRAVPGALAMAEHAARCGLAAAGACRAANAAEAALVPGIEILGAGDAAGARSDS